MTDPHGRTSTEPPPPTPPPATPDGGGGREAGEGRREPPRDAARGVSAHAAFSQHGRRAGTRRPPLVRTPVLVLAASLALTVGTAAVAWQAGRARDDALFTNATQAATDRITTRLEVYTALLHGARAMFAASEGVSATEFGEYVRQLALGTRYPGIQGIGYTRLLAPPGTALDSAALAAAVRAGGSPATRVWPDTARPEYHAIVYLEPLDRRNRAALGYDMSTEPTRREAMARARDTGRPAASGIVTLVQEIDVEKQAGFLVYVPVYTPGPPPATVDERRRRLRGFVYAPLRAGDLFSGIFGSESRPRVAFRAFAAPPADTGTATLLVDSRALARAGGMAGEPVRRLETIDVEGRTWTLAFAPAPGETDGGRWGALWIVVFGSAVSLALFHATRAEVRARTAAERSDALRTRFFAAMSHELRTPINAIMGYNDLILAELYGPVSDAQRNGLERSQRAAYHLLELVNDVLDVSKLESGKVEVRPEDVALDDLLDDLLVTIRPMATERGCVLQLDRRQRACGLVLRTDPRRLRQILLNLLSNATRFAPGRPVTVWCDALPTGGAVPGTHARRRDRRWTHGDAVVVAVHDDGPGIAPADHERIFEEFVQLPGATPGGTGLGLPISRRLAELLGGALTVESEPGRGSTFYVILPRTPRRERARHRG